MIPFKLVINQDEFNRLIGDSTECAEPDEYPCFCAVSGKDIFVLYSHEIDSMYYQLNALDS